MSITMHLVELGQGVFAWIHPTPKYGDSNVGLIIDEDGLTIIDTTATPDQAGAIRLAIESLTVELGLSIKRVVLTSSRIPFSGGSKAFWQAGFYGTETASDQLDLPPNPDAFRRLLPDHQDAYPDEFATRAITHTVDEPAWLTGAAFGVPLPGESASNLVVQVAGANMAFAGALAGFGVTPLAYDGDLIRWIESLEQLRSLADTIVPGHGPAGGHGDLTDLVNYLSACVEASGDPSAIPTGPWDQWSDRRFDEVNVERAIRLTHGDDSIPDAMFRLLGVV